MKFPQGVCCAWTRHGQFGSNVMEKFYARGVRTVAFGDLFLEDLRAWREANLAKAGMCGLFPNWRRDTTNLAHEVSRSNLSLHTG